MWEESSCECLSVSDRFTTLSGGVTRAIATSLMVRRWILYIFMLEVILFSLRLFVCLEWCWWYVGQFHLSFFLDRSLCVATWLWNGWVVRVLVWYSVCKSVVSPWALPGNDTQARFCVVVCICFLVNLWKGSLFFLVVMRWVCDERSLFCKFPCCKLEWLPFPLRYVAELRME